MLKVDRDTDYMSGLFPVEGCLADGERERLTEAAARDKYGDGGFWVMPLGDLFAVFDGDTRPLTDHGGASVFDVYRIRGVARFADQLAEALQRLTLAPTADEVKYAAGTTRPSFEVAIRVFCRDWFGLPDYKAVDSLTVTDLLIAKEAAYNHAVTERNIANAMKTRRR